MSERENILGRIREALSVPTDPHAGPIPSHAGLSPAANFKQLLPAVGANPEEQLSLFQTNAENLKATFQLVASTGELLDKLRELSAAEGWKNIGSHQGELADLACGALGLPVCMTDKGYKVDDLERCDAGISECDALVAQTGSVLITSRSAGGRALSVLPPHHVVLARRTQLIADLPEAFALLKAKYGANYPSLISFITGPSRTGDIERILVLGAHGPKKLTIFCLS